MQKAQHLSSDNVREKVNAHAEKVIASKFQCSRLEDVSPFLPQFSLSEIVQGDFLGKGNFGEVWEVLGLEGDIVSQTDKAASPEKSQPQRQHKKKRKWFQRENFEISTQTVKNPYEFAIESDDDEDNYCLYSEDIEEDLQQMENSVQGHAAETSPYQPKSIARSQKQQAARSFMKEHCLRESNGQVRYVIKKMRPDVISDIQNQYYRAVLDMVSEARMLAGLQHTNIVKLRGIAQGTQRCRHDFFLLLDRLYQTLDVRFELWGKHQKRLSSPFGRIFLDRKGYKRGKLWQERLIAAHDLAAGIAFLHSKKIIHRDLKADNIGFDIRGDIKIFDFGLARELPPFSNADMNGLFKMTGQTGTPRYMSPEVALEKPYNEACDTYTFCILFWEMLALKKAFELYRYASFETKVWRHPFKRPPLETKWSQGLKSLLQSGWHNVLTERQPMSEYMEVLRQEIVHTDEGFDEDWGLYDGEQERRSTHVFDEGDLAYLDETNRNFLSMLASPFRLSGRKPSVSEMRISPSKRISKLDTTSTTLPIANSPMDLEDESRPSRLLSPGMFPMAPPLIEDEDDSDDDDGNSRNDEAEENVSTTDIPKSKSNQSNRLYQQARKEISFSGSGTYIGAGKRQHTQLNEESDIMFEEVAEVRPRVLSSGTSGIWGRIVEEKARQESMRVRLSTARAQ